MKISAPIEQIMDDNGIIYSKVDKQASDKSIKVIIDMLVELGYGSPQDYKTD